MNLVCINIGNFTVIIGNNAYTGVNGSLILHTCADERTLGLKERNSLTLHV